MGRNFLETSKAVSYFEIILFCLNRNPRPPAGSYHFENGPARLPLGKMPDYEYERGVF